MTKWKSGRFKRSVCLAALLLCALGSEVYAQGSPGTQPRISSRNTHGGALSENTVKTGPEVGSVMITVTRARLWSNVKQDLLIDFNLTPDQALLQVIPKTQSEVYSLLEKFGFSMGVGLPVETVKNSTQKTSGSSLSPSGEPVIVESESRSENKTYESGSPVALPERAYSDKAGKTFLPGQITAAQGEDPLLRYQAATSLFQSVKLMQRTIQDAVDIDNHQAHIATLRLTIMPYARNMPYDMYSTIKFSGGGANSPKVIPLLITDQLEASSQMRESSRMLEAALSIAGAMYGVSANAKADWLRQQVSALSGRDLNSLLTIGCLRDDTLEVRVGAMLQGSSKLGLVAKTVDISFLILTDSGSDTKSLSYTATTQFRDTKTGKALPSPNDAALCARVFSEMGNVKWFKNNKFLYGVAATAMPFVIRNDKKGFSSHLERNAGVATDDYERGVLSDLYEKKDSLWASLAPIQERSMTKAGNFNLDQPIREQERVQAAINLVPIWPSTITGKTTEIIQFGVIDRGDRSAAGPSKKDNFLFPKITITELWLGGRKADKVVVTDTTITAFFSSGAWHSDREIDLKGYGELVGQYPKLREQVLTRVALARPRPIPPPSPQLLTLTSGERISIQQKISDALYFPKTEYLKIDDHQAISLLKEDLKARNDRASLAVLETGQPLKWTDPQTPQIMESAKNVQAELEKMKSVVTPTLLTSDHGVLRDSECVIEIAEEPAQVKKPVIHTIRVSDSGGNRTLELEEKGSLTGPTLIDAVREILAPAGGKKSD